MKDLIFGIWYGGILGLYSYILYLCYQDVQAHDAGWIKWLAYAVIIIFYIAMIGGALVLYVIRRRDV